MNKEYFKLTVEAQNIDEREIQVNMKIDGACDREMVIKSLYHMLDNLESQCEDVLHEALNLFLKDRGF